MPDDIKFVFQEDEKNISTENIEIIFDEELKKNEIIPPKTTETIVQQPIQPHTQPPVENKVSEKWKPDDIQDNTNIPVKETEQEWDDTHKKLRRRIRVVVKTDPNKPTI